MNQQDTSKKILKVISGVAILLSIALLGFFLLDKPTPPKDFVKVEPNLDLTSFNADLSSLTLPKDMYVSSAKKYEGRFYISDAFAKRVYCIDENSSIIWESKGEDRFILPNAKFPLDISEDGNLWVANSGRFKLEQLDLDTGKFIASWYPREKFKGCCNPVAILALSEGRFLAMEKGTNLLKIFQPDGSGEVLAKLKSNWQNFELRKNEDKIEYCNGEEIKTL